MTLKYGITTLIAHCSRTLRVLYCMIAV